MSAFLGPIHTWVYRKIKLQDELVNAILKMAEEASYADDISAQMDDRYGRLEEGELVDIIDEKNIHGWLQERVTLVENRLAFLITKLTEKYPERITNIGHIAFQVGKQYSLQEGLSVKEAYTYLDSLLLNGMPCDRVNEIESETDENLVWVQTVDIHEQYWLMLKGDMKYFYTIREQFATGVFEDSGISFISNGNQRFELRKEI